MKEYASERKHGVLAPKNDNEFVIVGVRFLNESSLSQKIYHYFMVASTVPCRPIGTCVKVDVEGESAYPVIVEYPYGTSIQAESPTGIPLKVVWGKAPRYEQEKFDKKLKHLLTQKEEKMGLNDKRSTCNVRGNYTPSEGQYHAIQCANGQYYFVCSAFNARIGKYAEVPADEAVTKYAYQRITWVSESPYDRFSGHSVFTVNAVYDKTPVNACTSPSVTKETKFMQPIKVENRTYVNGTLAKDLNDDQLISFIAESEGEIKRLSELKTAASSTSIKKRLDALQAGIDSLVQLLDARSA